MSTEPPVQLTPAPQGYADVLSELKAQIHEAQQRAAQAVNLELISLYWRIGHTILKQQGTQGWGAKVVDRLVHDLRTAFPDMQGFSVRNLKYMRAFAQVWADPACVQQLLHKLPWGHNVVLLEKLSTPEDRRWYATQAPAELQTSLPSIEQIGRELGKSDRLAENAL